MQTTDSLHVVIWLKVQKQINIRFIQDGLPKITWAEAKRMTRKTVEKALERKQLEATEYAEATGITKNMARATCQYANWSAATERRLLSSKGVKVRMLA